MLHLDPPELVRQIADAVHANGGRALLVGGSVRDALSDGVIKDWDLEVYGLDTDELERLLKRLGRVNTVGRAFSVFKLMRRGLEVDVSIPRRDNKKGPGHKGIEATGDPTMTPEEAVRRRDLTINAIMLDVRTGEVLDPAGGQADLANGVLRAVDDTTFLEDPLRALRVVQFLARLDATAHPSLEALCANAALGELPGERVLMEWTKLCLKGHRPSAGIAFARRTGVLARVFPEHPHPVALDAALDRAVALRDALEPEGRRLALLIAAWLAHAPAGAWEATLDRLKLHRWNGFPTRDVALAAAAHHADPIATDADLRRLSVVTEPDLALRVREAVDGRDTRSARDRAAMLGVSVDAPQPLLQGRDLVKLGHRPGPWMGAVLARVYDAQLEGTVTTRDEALEVARPLLPAQAG